MGKKRLFIITILVICTLLLASIGLARESVNSTAPKKVAPYPNTTASRLQEISDSEIVIDSNSQMKVAVDNYMDRLKAQKEAEKAARQAEEAAKQARIEQAAAPESIESKQARAEQILASLIAQNPILKGATVTVRECPHNWQGCTYYKSAIIWIDPDHRASLEKIMVHECNHIIDWRSDGDIDYNDYHE